MTDKELLDWITRVRPESDTMPADTGPRMIRLVQMLIADMGKVLPGEPPKRRGRPPKERLQVKQGKIVK